ncbi:immunoglobulin superfamily member 6 [Labeo rohita]|uniref:immunoglobulin superfamily member 6 n=1 Tax=Labeo rohita TaxID=84645 RepID=UPI0021E1DF9E|nr:immunoglobulin superfamily member 6 [Labeo rohita]
MNVGLLFASAFIFSTVSGCKLDVQQPTKLIRRKEQQSVSIPCSVTPSSCPKEKLQIFWYVFRKDNHSLLDSKTSSSEDLDLKISSLSLADSGVYYCAAALLKVANSGAQEIGQGTILKVSENGLNVRQTLLLTLLVLLTVYSVLVLGTIISIKTGQFKSVLERRWSKSEKKEDSTRQVLFSGVVQELCKRNLVGVKIQTHYKVSQDKSTDLQNGYHSEDVYQNLDE